MIPNTTDDARHMARAIQLARRGLFTTDPNPRVGCVVVNDGRVVGEGWHEKAGEAHAEILALKLAGERARGATAYVTLEPCCHHGRTPPCTRALIDAGIGRVVAAMVDPNPQVSGQGIRQLTEAGIHVDCGLMQAAAEQLNPGFIRRMRDRRPFVRIKLATSLDGRTALSNGESKWITGDAAREDVQRLRARSSAILTGVGTVLADDPSLTVRSVSVTRQPLRIVVDGNLSLRSDAKLLGLPGSTLVVTAEDSDDYAAPLLAAGAEVMVLRAAPGRVDFPQLLEHLAERGVNELLVEAGATVSGALIAGDLVDEVVVYIAPHLMGSNARGMFSLPGLEQMDDRVELDITEVRAVGRDWRITARCRKSK